jgi:hypothetical protein
VETAQVFYVQVRTAAMRSWMTVGAADCWAIAARAAERDWGIVKSTLATCGCRVVTHDQLVAEGGSSAADRASDDLRRQAITAAGWMTLIDAE